MSRWSAPVLARDLLPVALGAWMIFHTLRSEVGERYDVPSRSMEPTLHGSPSTGDVVLVDKTAFWPLRALPLERFDLVVVANRHEPGHAHLVKRFITAGPAEVAVREGDLFIRGADARSLERVVKDPREHLDLRQTAFVFEVGSSGDPPGDHLVGMTRVEAGALVIAARPRDQLLGQLTPEAQGARASESPPSNRLSGFLATAQPLDTGFLDATGAILAAGRGDVRDLGLELSLTTEAGVESLVFVIEVLEVYHAIEYLTSGRLRVSVMGAPVGAEIAAPAIEPDRPLDLEFGYLDGRLFLVVDGELVLWLDHDIPLRSARELVATGVGPRHVANGLHVAAIGTGAVRCDRVRAFHDVHWQPRAETYRLEPGEIFVMGDNSFDSSDSRDHPSEPFRVEDLIGRPVAVIAPAARRRWL